MGFYGGLIGSKKITIWLWLTAVCHGKIHHAFLRTVVTINFDKWAMVIFHGELLVITRWYWKSETSWWASGYHGILYFQQSQNLLVVWNHGTLWLSIQLGMECHHPNWRTPWFFRGIGWNPNQLWIWCILLTSYNYNHKTSIHKPALFQWLTGWFSLISECYRLNLDPNFWRTWITWRIVPKVDEVYQVLLQLQR